MLGGNATENRTHGYCCSAGRSLRSRSPSGGHCHSPSESSTTRCTRRSRRNTTYRTDKRGGPGLSLCPNSLTSPTTKTSRRNKPTTATRQRLLPNVKPSLGCSLSGMHARGRTRRYSEPNLNNYAALRSGKRPSGRLNLSVRPADRPAASLRTERHSGDGYSVCWWCSDDQSVAAGGTTEANAAEVAFELRLRVPAAAEPESLRCRSEYFCQA